MRFFSELCQFARDETDYELDCDPIFVSDEVKGLQEICAVAEGEMEKFWSKKIQFAQDPQKMLKSFIYYQNYEDLTSVLVEIPYFSVTSCAVCLWWQ